MTGPNPKTTIFSAAATPAPRGRLLKLSLIGASLILGGCALTPKPITMEERSKNIEQDFARMYEGQEKLTGPLTLEEAMARAVKYNLEHRLRKMEEALSLGQFDQARFEMLPRLTLAAGYLARNNELVSDSIDVDTRKIILSNSTSQDRMRDTMDLSLTWNVLDFGVSYFQAQQQGDRALVLRERRRKTLHNLMQQIRQAYWQAVGAQALEQQVDPLLAAVNRALADSEQVGKEKLRPPLELLNYRKLLLDLVRQLEAIRDELAQAKPRLAALVNLPYGQEFQLHVPPTLEFPALNVSIDTLEQRALRQRPELIEADLQERISHAEIKKAIARMFPGIELSTGPHYDSNSFLHNKKWIEGGVRVTWNLFSLITGPQQKKIAEAQSDVQRAQRLALNIAVITQVNVAVRDFLGRRRQFDLAQDIYELDRQINEQTTAAAKNDAQSRLNSIRSGAAALMADYRRYQNFAGLQTAYAQIIASTGVDPIPEAPSADNVATMAQSIKLRLDATLNVLPAAK